MLDDFREEAFSDRRGLVLPGFTFTVPTDGASAQKCGGPVGSGQGFDGIGEDPCGLHPAVEDFFAGPRGPPLSHRGARQMHHSERAGKGFGGDLA